MTKNEMAAMYSDLHAAALGEYAYRPIAGRQDLPAVVLLDKNKLTQTFEDTWEKYMEVFAAQTKQIALLKEQVAAAEHRLLTNETTELESGAPKLPGSDIEPRIGQGVASLCDSLGIKPQHRFWEHLVIHEIGQEGKEEFLVSFMGNYYQPNREECQLFLGRLREVALSRRSRRWTARFDKSCLRIKEI